MGNRFKVRRDTERCQQMQSQNPCEAEKDNRKQNLRRSVPLFFPLGK